MRKPLLAAGVATLSLLAFGAGTASAGSAFPATRAAR
jgi:hypothetical protein